jgi:Tfp pilus assembly protein PilF
VRLGEYYLKDDSKIDEAERLLLKAISKDYDDADAHVALGKVYEKQEKVDEAIDQF